MKTLYDTCSDNCCAYCKYHRCGVTVRQLRLKECPRKQCRHLQINTEHQYWQQREIKKEKKNRKKRLLEQYANSFGRNEREIPST